MLVGAGVRYGGNPMRSMGGASAGSIERARWGLAGALRNLHAGEATVISGACISARSGYPLGCLAPASWSLPNKPGGLSSRGNTSVSLAAAGNISRGLTTGGSVSFTLSAAGTMLAVGSVAGTAAFALDTAGDAYGQAAIAGTADLSLSATGTLGALAYLTASAGFALSAAATMGCTAQVVGPAYLSGSAEGNQLSTAGIAEAVWTYLIGADQAKELLAAESGLSAEQAVQLAELHKIHGLLLGSPLIVTSTARTASDIEQTVDDNGAGAVTVTRVASSGGPADGLDFSAANNSQYLALHSIGI